MSNMVIYDSYKPQILAQAFGVSGYTAEDYTLMLFSNNVTVSNTDTLGTYTEASFTGYARVPIARSTFGTPTVSGSVATMLSSVVPTFTCTGGGGQTVYGWVLLGVTSGDIVAGQNFPAGRDITSGLSEIVAPFQIQLEDL
jgi:hypothetical protein